MAETLTYLNIYMFCQAHGGRHSVMHRVSIDVEAERYFLNGVVCYSDCDHMCLYLPLPLPPHVT